MLSFSIHEWQPLIRSNTNTNSTCLNDPISFTLRLAKETFKVELIETASKYRIKLFVPFMKMTVIVLTKTFFFLHPKSWSKRSSVMLNKEVLNWIHDFMRSLHPIFIAPFFLICISRSWHLHLAWEVMCASFDKILPKCNKNKLYSLSRNIKEIAKWVNE